MLTPTDIQTRDFEKKLKGYSCDEVDDFLDVVIQDYDFLFKENQTLKNKIGMLTETVENYKQMENALKQSIDMAKKTADDMKRNAEREAESIINKAKLDASYLARQIDDEHDKKHRQLLAVQNEADNCKKRVKLLCESIIKMVDGME